MQSFMGTINFVQIFVPDFAQIVNPLQQMVKKSVQFKWIDIEKGSFVIFLSFIQYDLRILSERITCTAIITRDKRQKEFSLRKP